MFVHDRTLPEAAARHPAPQRVVTVLPCKKTLVTLRQVTSRRRRTGLGRSPLVARTTGMCPVALQHLSTPSTHLIKWRQTAAAEPPTRINTKAHLTRRIFATQSTHTAHSLLARSSHHESRGSSCAAVVIAAHILRPRQPVPQSLTAAQQQQVMTRSSRS